MARHSQKLIPFIKAYESLHDGDLSRVGLFPKLCAAGYWTEGYGRVIRLNGKMANVEDFPTLEDVEKYRDITNEKEAETALDEDLDLYSGTVTSLIKGDVKLTQEQFDALVSHVYNCGVSATLFRLINEKAPLSEIKNWWTTKYITGNGVYLKGLQYRRNDEWEMFTNGDYSRGYHLTI